MKEITAIILGGGRGSRLNPLTRLRAKPAVPIGGKFRLIDVPISNCLHSGVHKIFVMTQFNTESLHRHIHNTYRFDTFSKGYIRLLAAQQTSENQDWYQGNADAVRKNLMFLTSADNHIIILAGDHLYRMDYQKFFEYHLKVKADISVAVKPIYEHEAAEFGILKMDKKGIITDFYEKPKDREILEKFRIDQALFDHFKTEAKNRSHVASMGIYIFKKDVLFKLLENTNHQDFGKEIVPSALSKRKVAAYFFDGYWEDIGTMRSFFNAHMRMTHPVPEFNFYDENYPFYTRPRYLPASKINNCQINHSLVSEGCILLGSIVEHSVVGIRSFVDEGTLIQRSILMGNQYYETITNRNRNRELGKPNLGIGNNCIIRNTIIDLDCFIGNNVQLINKDNQTDVESDLYFIKDGIIIIPKETVIPDNTII
jgi:glucose-1-phosphate adenylyltransferase